MNRKVSETKTSNGVKIKYLFNQNRKQINPNSLEGLDVCHYSIPNVQEVGKGVIENGTDIESNKFLIEHEQLLVSKLNPRKQTVCLSHPEETVTVCSTEFISLYPKEKNVDLNYSRYVFMMSETTELLDSMVESVTRSHQRIQPEKFENLYFPLPPLDEQQLISRYLDKKTEQIDSLIEKIQKKIELLKEQRTSLINQCVTKGLDPNVEMKDSGVEWIGEIPKHWDRVRVKHIVSTKITDGPHETPEFVDEGIPFLSVEGVVGNKINLNRVRGYITPELHEIYSKKIKPMKEDVLLVKSGSTTGKSTIVDIDVEFNIWSPLCILRSDRSKIDPYYLFNSVQSRYFRIEVETNWSYGTQPNIGMGVIEELWIVLPPVDEQTEINKYLKDKTHVLNGVIDKHLNKITLYKEYRQSLISSVVTGKVRVMEDMI